jgi:hypothetical protein
MERACRPLPLRTTIAAAGSTATGDETHAAVQRNGSVWSSATASYFCHTRRPEVVSVFYKSYSTGQVLKAHPTPLQKALKMASSHTALTALPELPARVE